MGTTLFRLRTTLTFTLALVLPTLVVPNSAAAADKDDLLDAHFQALGGKVAIAKIETIRRAGDVTLDTADGALTGTIVQAAVVGKKAYEQTDFNIFSERKAWDGKSAWKRNAEDGVETLTGDDLEGLKMDAAVGPIAALHAQYGAAAFQPSAKKELEGKTYDALGVVGSPLVFYLDPETHLLAVMSVPQAVVSYDDYREVEGVMFPFEVSIEIAGGALVIDLHYLKTTVNESIDDARFERPKD